MEKEIFALLRIMTRTVRELREKVAKEMEENAFESEILEPLKAEGMIEIDEFGIVNMTNKARKAPENRAQRVKANLVVPDGSTTYEGRELGKTCHRPGAYDFLAHPSRVGNTLYYRQDGEAK